jgi:hypothetical protein
MTLDKQDKPFVAYLKAQPKWDTPRGWFPGMGQTPKPPRSTSQDNYLWKRRDRS